MYRCVHSLHLFRFPGILPPPSLPILCFFLVQLLWCDVQPRVAEGPTRDFQPLDHHPSCTSQSALTTETRRPGTRQRKKPLMVVPPPSEKVRSPRLFLEITHSAITSPITHPSIHSLCGAVFPLPPCPHNTALIPPNVSHCTIPFSVPILFLRVPPKKTVVEIVMRWTHPL